MADLEAIEKTEDTKGQGVAADLLIAISATASEDDLRRGAAAIIAALQPSLGSARIAVAYPGSVEETPAASASSAPEVQFLPYNLPQNSASSLPWLASVAAYREIESVASKTGARACVVLAPDLAALDAGTVEALAKPVLEGRAELAMPLYPLGKYEGLLNTAILYPFTRALYGKRIRNPLAPDFGISARLLSRLAAEQTRGPQAGQGQPVLWPVTEAVLANSIAGQAHVPTHHNTQTEGLDLSTVLGLLVGSVFNDVEKNAALWQRLRGSQHTQTWGMPAPPAAENDGVDPRPMIESFTLGSRNLQEVWSLVLPPVTLLELKRMARLTPEQFRMPDALWVKIVYDFALAYRLRTISRTHLLGALTPLYLGWVAAYVTEIRALNAAAAEQRVEQLAAAYEDGKPYLVSRWRWPDRFNP